MAYVEMDFAQGGSFNSSCEFWSIVSSSTSTAGAIVMQQTSISSSGVTYSQNNYSSTKTFSYVAQDDTIVYCLYYNVSSARSVKYQINGGTAISLSTTKAAPIRLTAGQYFDVTVTQTTGYGGTLASFAFVPE